MSDHHGTTVHGTDYEIKITPATVFRDYNTPGMERAEVAVSEGVITINQFLPEEMNEWQTRSLAALLMDAADEKERQDAAVVEEVALRPGATVDGRFELQPGDVYEYRVERRR